MNATQAVNFSTSVSFSEITSFSSFAGTGAAAGNQGTTSAAPTSTAQISGPGRLLSDLQQLQAQNNTAFTQVLTDIAKQLSAAAQSLGQSNQTSQTSQTTQETQFSLSISESSQTQNQSGVAHLLQDLSNLFQNVANTGDLSQLQGRHHHGPRTYSSSGHPVSSTAQSGGNSPLGQLFATITQEVSQALSATSTGSAVAGAGSSGKA